MTSQAPQPTSSRKSWKRLAKAKLTWHPRVRENLIHEGNWTLWILMDFDSHGLSSLSICPHVRKNIRITVRSQQSQSVKHQGESQCGQLLKVHSGKHGVLQCWTIPHLVRWFSWFPHKNFHCHVCSIRGTLKDHVKHLYRSRYPKTIGCFSSFPEEIWRLNIG